LDRLCVIDANGATTSLNAARRATDLASIGSGVTVDVLVVGLGVTGAGAALDAASRGLSVVAVDRYDLAYGTSRWSSKLVHGGLRYLASGDIAVAYECAKERGILLTRTAPHIARPVPVILPLSAHVSPGTARLHRVGIAAGDVLRQLAGTPKAVLPLARRISADESLALAPGLRKAGLRGANLNWDGQLEDDARLVTAIARTAAGLGARILTRCRALDLDADGASLRDELTGSGLTIRARAVINATGVWADQLVDNVALRPSRGTHIVVRSESLGGLRAELTIPVEGQRGRFVVAIPQRNGLTYVGITDEPVDGPIEEVPRPPESDIDFLLGAIGDALEEPLRRTDVVGAFAGLRPLFDDGENRTADVSRRHAILTSTAGVVTVVGGKLTTYRKMAEQAVDSAIRRHRLPYRRTRTADLPLVGAASPSVLAGIAAPARLVRRYGTEAPAVAALAQGHPELDEPVAAGLEVTGAELVWAIRHEGAMNADDLLDRRCRIGLVAAERAAALPAAQRLIEAWMPAS
jgi:glycerol-3-phosphate dehydrogenase